MSSYREAGEYDTFATYCGKMDMDSTQVHLGRLQYHRGHQNGSTTHGCNHRFEWGIWIQAERLFIKAAATENQKGTRSPELLLVTCYMSFVLVERGCSNRIYSESSENVAPRNLHLDQVPCSFGGSNQTAGMSSLNSVDTG
jgi:hypothetical protein